MKRVDEILFGERIADAERAVVPDADDVAGDRIVGDVAVLPEEKDRTMNGQRLAGADVIELHAATEFSGAEAHERDPVAVVRIHVRLHLEDKARNGAVVRLHDSVGGGLWPRWRRFGRDQTKQFFDRVVLEGAAKDDGREVSLAKGVFEELRIALAREHDLVVILGEHVGRHVVEELWIVEAGHLEAEVEGAAAAVRRRQEYVGFEIRDAGKIRAHAHRPGDRRGVEGELRLDLVEQLEGVPCLAVDLVDEGDDRNVAEPADLEELSRLGLDAFRGVDDHDGGIDRCQRAVGVLGKILVAGCVEQVEYAARRARSACTVEDTEMPRSRSIAIQSERVRRRSPRARTAPAMRIAPPFRSSFSVSVVLPASGCEMIAKVRRARQSAGAAAVSSRAGRSAINVSSDMAIFVETSWRPRRPRR